MPVADAILNINFTYTIGSDFYWKGVEAFHSQANTFVDNGMLVYYELSELRLHVQPYVAPKMNAAPLDKVLKPIFGQARRHWN